MNKGVNFVWELWPGTPHGHLKTPFLNPGSLERHASVSEKGDLEACRALNNKATHTLSAELAETSDNPLITLYSSS